MGGATPAWLALAAILFGGGGFAAQWVLARTTRRVEGLKNATQENSVALDWFNAAMQRANDEITRKDKTIADQETRIGVLEAEVVRLMRQEKP